MNCPDKNTVRDHKTPGGIRLPLSTNMFERTLASRKGLTLVASRNVVCSLARSNSSSSWSNKVVYLVLYSPIVFIPLRRRRRRRRQKKTRHTYSEHTELLLQDSSRDLSDTLDFSMFFFVLIFEQAKSLIKETSKSIKNITKNMKLFFFF